MPVYVPVYAFGDVEPDIHPDSHVHPDAVVIGNVTIGAEEYRRRAERFRTGLHRLEA